MQTAGKLEPWLAKIDAWFSEPSSTLGIFLRALGGVLLISGLFQISSLSLQPYLISPWSFGAHIVNIPRLPPLVDLFMYLIYFGCAFALLLGFRRRALVITVLSIFVATASREMVAVTSNFQYILLTYVIAALFANDKPSATPRLVQLCLSTSYLFAVLHKLVPEFLDGYTLAAIFRDGWGLRPIWLPMVQSLHPPMMAFCVLSWLVVASEGFLAIGLWYPRTRRITIVFGITVHLAFSLFLTVIDYASLVMILGYVPLWGWGNLGSGEDSPIPAAVAAGSRRSTDKDSGMAASVAAGSRRSTDKDSGMAIKAIAGLLIFASPLRAELRQPDLPLPSLDEHVGGFGMFSVKTKTERLEMSVGTDDGRIISITPTGRCANIAFKRDVQALANYLRSQYKDAKTVKVVLIENANNRLTKTTIFTAIRRGDDFDVSSTESLQPRSETLEDRRSALRG